MNKRILTAITAMSMALTAAGCGSAEPVTPAGNEYSFQETTENTTPDFNSAAADFSAELFKAICTEDIASGRNAFASPESVMLALGLAANGAGGDTLAQFEQVMGGGMKLKEINSGLARLMTKAGSSSYVKYNIANSIWVKQGDEIRLKNSYAQTCKERLDADSYLVPFNNDTIDQINSWVDEHTDGMIDKIKEDFAPDEAAVLLSAITFDAKWSDPYETANVTTSTFHAADGSEQECKMMHSTEYTYVTDGSAQGFVKQYQGGQYAFMALLPEENVSLSDYVSTLTGDKLLSVYNDRRDGQTVYAALPEFSFDWGGSIAKGLKAMGLDKAFDPAADFTNMAETATGQLYIGDVIHKTHIEVNTEGTKAAAVTEVEMKCGGAMNLDEIKTVTLDRPFLFTVIDTETGLPVFMGAVNSMS